MTLTKKLPDLDRDSRIVRFLSFSLIGITGIAVDAMFVGILLTFHVVPVLLANFAAWVVAMTWNFSLNYHLTYDRPDGSLTKFYAAYASSRGVTFILRAIWVFFATFVFGIQAFTASLIGILLAASLGFVLAEFVYGEGRVI